MNVLNLDDTQLRSACYSASQSLMWEARQQTDPQAMMRYSNAAACAELYADALEDMIRNKVLASFDALISVPEHVDLMFLDERGGLTQSLAVRLSDFISDVSLEHVDRDLDSLIESIERGAPSPNFKAVAADCAQRLGGDPLGQHLAELTLESKCVDEMTVPTVSYDILGERYTLALYLDRYQSNDNLALAAIDISENGEGFGEQWGALTVNLPDDPVAASWCAEEGHVVFDLNNNSRALAAALVDAGIIEWSGKFTHSGFCDYPLATITPEAMSNLRGFRETADRILTKRQETELQQGYEQGGDSGVSLKGEAEAMRESASQLCGGDVPSKPNPQR